MTTKKQQTYVAVSFGWGNTFAVPTENVSTFLAMLDGCIRVEDDSYRDGEDYKRYWYTSGRKNPPSLEIINGLILNEKIIKPEDE